jgi:hypothetical protein
MARSNYVWVIGARDNRDPVVGAYTVKRELLQALQPHHRLTLMRWHIYRIGPSGSVELLSRADDFLRTETEAPAAD